MRPALRLLFVCLLALGVASTRVAAATTADQLIALQRAGLDDDILIALIQTDGSIFHLSAEDILDLHRQGLSNKVIRAMQETAKVETAPTETAQAEQRQAVRSEAPGVVNVYQTVTQRVETRPDYPVPVYTIPVAVPVYISRPVVPRAAAPVYWGWGGQRRPDSWDDRPVAPRDDRNPSDKYRMGR